MPYVPFEDCVSVSVCGVYSGQRVCITLGFCKDTFSLGDIALLKTDIEDWLGTDLVPLQNPGMTWDEIVITNLTTVSSPSYEYSISEVGTLNVARMPNNVAMCVTFNTDLRGRSYRGRNYIPALTTGQSTSPVEWTASAIADMLAAYAALAAAVDADGWTHVVLSRYNNLEQRTVGVATPVTGYAVDTSIDSQRRRLAGRGD